MYQILHFPKKKLYYNISFTDGDKIFAHTSPEEHWSVHIQIVMKDSTLVYTRFYIYIQCSY